MPFVTISRMYGSGGSVVAARVASALGWELLDNAIVERVAEQLGWSSAEVAAREERVPSLVERLTTALALGSNEFVATVPAAALVPEEERLLAVTERVIREAVSLGPVVLVGRGAQAMLAARADALHVFCHAPRPALVARVMHRRGIGEEDAAREVDEVNRQREQYVRRYWRRAWLASTGYHLCLDTEWLGVDGAAALVVALARERLG
jgi:cytidylate kinase